MLDLQVGQTKKKLFLRMNKEWIKHRNKLSVEYRGVFQFLEAIKFHVNGFG